MGWTCCKSCFPSYSLPWCTRRISDQACVSSLWVCVPMVDSRIFVELLNSMNLMRSMIVRLILSATQFCSGEYGQLWWMKPLLTKNVENSLLRYSRPLSARRVLILAAHFSKFNKSRKNNTFRFNWIYKYFPRKVVHECHQKPCSTEGFFRQRPHDIRMY